MKNSNYFLGLCLLCAIVLGTCSLWGNLEDLRPKSKNDSDPDILTPNAPTVTSGNQHLTVEWQPVEGASAYEIWFGTTNDPQEAKQYGEDISSGHSTVIYNLENNVAYYVWIKAKNLIATSDFSPPATGTPQEPTDPPQAPSAPDLIIGDGQITVDWHGVEGADSYEVWLNTENNSSSAKQSGSDISDYLSLIISPLENGTLYYVWVTAKNDLGTSDFSSPASAMPLGTPNAPQFTTGLRQLTLTWDQVLGADEYELYFGEANSPTTRWDTTTERTATIDNLSSGTTYYARLKAKNAYGTSDYGPSANATLATPAAGLYRNGTFVANYDLAASMPYIATNAAEGDDYLIVLDKDETITADANATGFTLGYSNRTVKITLLGSGREITISRSTNGSYFTVNRGVTLTLDENITLSGRSSNNRSLIEVNPYGDLVMNEGSAVKGNTNNSTAGGGIYISWGTFTMNGGEISGNSSESSSSSAAFPAYGGGVYLENGDFIMNDGKISGNWINRFLGGGDAPYGGGVHISNGNFTMNGGTISENYILTYTSAYGGGVSVSNGEFIMTNGEISGNYVQGSPIVSVTYSYGGGVHITGGTFTMINGKISGNSAIGGISKYAYGGGVSVGANGRFDMGGGEISGNICNGYSGYNGGGVYVSTSGGMITKTGGTIYGYSSTSSTNPLWNTVRYSSTATNGYGHAVYVSSSMRHDTTVDSDHDLNSNISGAGGGW